MPNFYIYRFPDIVLTDFANPFNIDAYQSWTITTTTLTNMPNISRTDGERISEGIDLQELYRRNSNAPQIPRPENFSSAAEYERAMRRYYDSFGNDVMNKSKITEEKSPLQKEKLNEFLHFVKDYLKDKSDKTTIDELNFIEKMLSDKSINEIIDEYFC